MARIIVGGRSFEHGPKEVILAMRDRDAEPIREHFVNVDGVGYPPKQVLATVTGWDRQSFTTMEAQRVLAKLGFECKRVTAGPVMANFGEPSQAPTAERSSTVEDRLEVIEGAVAGLLRRVKALESSI